MVNNVWSKKIQGILTLDLSREVRFRDDRKDLFLQLLGLKPGMTVVDVGCGPGTLTRKLAKWLGKESKIIGVDFDTDFIKYAREKAVELNLKNVIYYEGDALKLPLSDNSVDACISHTVIEHVPNREFLIEQKRICSPGGRVSVMYCRPDKYIKSTPNLLPQISERERELLEKIYQGSEDINKRYKVGEYWPDSSELPSLFDELGFANVQVDAIAIPIVIDDARNSYAEKIMLVESEKEQLLERLEISLNMDSKKLFQDEIRELKELVEERFSKRLDFLKKGINIWDYTIIIIQIVSGIVKKSSI
ncbi:class I SAM-dependent methyltransferase [Caloranaerobacter azorensis]|uniref:Methyltransferase domain-containing protein n=1 Tax=Caloranaerobacter azorensis TaxID=116090 RepID=A0A6P1YC87_9FIRM|nr:methyltransferase domain-containing protein [Caloranaerobacter azorensis]QIB26714.1 methyltransferase domain-containing protein [Caloranaerobacter azorensis]